MGASMLDRRPGFPPDRMRLRFCSNSSPERLPEKRAVSRKTPFSRRKSPRRRFLGAVAPHGFRRRRAPPTGLTSGDGKKFQKMRRNYRREARKRAGFFDRMNRIGGMPGAINEILLARAG